MLPLLKHPILERRAGDSPECVEIPLCREKADVLFFDGPVRILHVQSHFEHSL